MMPKDWKKDLLNVPNLLSLFRLILIPVYITIYLGAEETVDYLIAAAILAVSCLTDMIDGKIARHFNLITTIGQVLDPVADKATQFALIICLAIKYPILWIVIGLFLVKESFQLVAMLIMYKKGKMLRGAIMSGKVCTTVLFVSLILLVLLPNITINFVYIITAIDVIVMLVAFYCYVAVYLKQGPMIRDV